MTSPDDSSTTDAKNANVENAGADTESQQKSEQINRNSTEQQKSEQKKYGPIFDPFSDLFDYDAYLFDKKMQSNSGLDPKLFDDLFDGVNANKLHRINRAHKERGFKFTMANDEDDDLSNFKEIPPDVWVPERALEAINMEMALSPEASQVTIANKILKDNAAIVAVGVTHTAKYASDPRLRFQAQTYVLDRVLGKVGVTVSNEDSPMEELTKQLMQLVESAASSSGLT